jgi:hypothetical protein
MNYPTGHAGAAIVGHVAVSGCSVESSESNALSPPARSLSTPQPNS